MVLETGNATGDSKHQEKVALCSQITLPAKLHRPSSNRQRRSQSVKLLYSAHANIPGRFQITCRNWRDSWALHNGDTSQELYPELRSIKPLGSSSTHACLLPKPRLFYHPTCYSLWKTKLHRSWRCTPAPEKAVQKNWGWRKKTTYQQEVWNMITNQSFPPDGENQLPCCPPAEDNTGAPWAQHPSSTLLSST